MNNDLISREALKKALHNEIGEHALSVAIDRVIDNAQTVVNEYTKGFADGERSGRNFPLTNEEKAILVRQWLPQGKWIMQRHDLDGCFYTCSNCGRMIRVPLFIDDPEDNETLADYPFCHCGAAMQKGGKE